MMKIVIRILLVGLCLTSGQIGAEEAKQTQLSILVNAMTISLYAVKTPILSDAKKLKSGFASFAKKALKLRNANAPMP